MDDNLVPEASGPLEPTTSLEPAPSLEQQQKKELDKEVELNTSQPPSPQKVSKEIIEEAEDTTDIFDELPVIFIGIYSFDNKELVDKFGDKDTDSNKTISLLKRVFQKKYPITRVYGLPKVPSKKSDKELLIKLLQNYFESLRITIIRKRKKHGNSMSLRQLIDQIQHIKILKEHFEEDKETFPYHLFKQFIDNEDYLDFNEDLVKQIDKIKFRENEDNRIRNLLRQFTKVYLLQRTNEEFTLSDPGESKKRFELFKTSFKEKIPKVLRDLIDLLEGKTKEIALEKGEDINYDALYNLLIQLSNEFETIKKEGSTQKDTGNFDTMTGGQFKFSKDDKIDKSVNSFVHHLFDEYKKLKDSQDDSFVKHTGELDAKDMEVKRQITKINNEKEESERRISSLSADIVKLTDIIKAKDTEIDNLNKNITELTEELKKKTDRENNCEKELIKLDEDIRALERSSSSPSPSSSSSFPISPKDILLENARLIKEKERLQDSINKINEELQLQKGRVIKLSSDKKEALAEKTAAQEQLESANARIKELETQLESTIPREEHLSAIANKDDTIKELRADIADKIPRKDYYTATTKLAASQATINSKNAQLASLQSRIDSLTVANAELQRMIVGLNELPDKISEKEVESTALSKRIAALEAELATKSGENTRISSELAASIAASKALQDELAALRTTLTNSNSQKTAALNEALANIEKLNGELGKLVATNQGLVDERDSLNRERDALKSQLAEIRSTSSSVANTKQGEIDRLTREISSKDAKILEQTNALAAQVSEIAALKQKASEVDVLRGLSAKNELIINGLRGKLATLSNQCELLIQQQDGISKREKELSAELEKANEKLKRANESLESKDKSYQDTIKTLQGQIAGLMEQNASLVKQISDCGKIKLDLAKKEAEITALREKYRRDIEEISRTSVSDLERLEASYQSKLAEQAVTISGLQAKYTEALTAKNLLEEETERLRAIIADLSSKLAGTSTKAQALHNQFSRISFGPNRVPEPPISPIEAGKIENLDLIIRDQQFLNSFNMFINTYYKNYKDQYDYKDMYNVLKSIYININRNNNPALLSIKSKLNEINSYIKRLDSTLGLDKTNFNNFGLTLQRNGKSEKMKQDTVKVLELLIDLIPDDSLDKETFENRIARINQNQIYYGGIGGSKDPLYKYAIQIANDRLDDFLIDEPLPFFGLIKSFDKSIIRETNEKYLLELFVEHQLEEHFTTDEMKDFFTQFQLIFDKTEDLSQLCFILYEICNSIKKEDDIDTVRYKSTEYNSKFDKLEQILKTSSFDFYDIASKQLHELKLIDIKYHDGYIYFKKNTNSFEHTYEIDSTLNIEKTDYEFNEELYIVNNKLIYFFFILSVYNVIKSDIKDLEIVDTLLKHTRTTKRNLKKSVKKLIKEKLDG